MMNCELKEFRWEKHNNNSWYVIDYKACGKEFFVKKNISGYFYIDECKETIQNYYNQEVPRRFKNKFEVMEWITNQRK